MALDKIMIGTRVRKIREKIYHETRQVFAERCGLTLNNLGKLERGETLITSRVLDKICSKTGTNPNYILYGECENENLSLRKTIENFLDNSNAKDLKMYFKFISAIQENKD